MDIISNSVKANNLRKGDIVAEGEGMYIVNSAEHSMTGKRTACVQVQMKALKTSAKDTRGSMNKRYMPDESVEIVTLVEEPCTFLYVEDGKVVAMRAEDKGCDLITMTLDDEIEPWLTDGMQLTVYFNEDSPLYFALPKYVDCTVASTEVSLKNQRVTSSYKPAELQNGKVIQVPSFVKEDDRITIRTEDFSYMSRAKEE